MCLSLLVVFQTNAQWLMVVASVNVEWPQLLAAPFSALAWLFGASSMATGLDCLLAQHNNHLSLAVRNVLFGLLMPVALLLLLIALDRGVLFIQLRMGRRRRSSTPNLAPVLMQQASRRHSRRTHAGAIAQTCIVVVFFFLPSLLRTAYGMFTCVTLDAAPQGAAPPFLRLNAVGTFWLLDTQQQCFTDYHLRWALGVGVPLILIFCILVPFGIIGYLSARRTRLQEPFYLQHFSFLYKSYRQCYWEGVVALQVRRSLAGSEWTHCARQCIEWGLALGSAHGTALDSICIVPELVRRLQITLLCQLHCQRVVMQICKWPPGC